jgi:hypothetical protein
VLGLFKWSCLLGDSYNWGYVLKGDGETSAPPNPSISLFAGLRVSTHSNTRFHQNALPLPEAQTHGYLNLQNHEPKQMFLYFVSSLGQGYYSDTKLTNTVAGKMSGGGRKSQNGSQISGQQGKWWCHPLEVTAGWAGKMR